MAEDAAEDVPAPSPSGQASKEKDSTGLVLPLARIKKMMRDAADAKTVSTEANFVVGRAAELFLQDFAARAHAVMRQDEQRKAQMIDYKDLAAVVQNWDALEFLRDVVPQKVSAASILAQIEQQQQQQQPEGGEQQQEEHQGEEQ